MEWFEDEAFWQGMYPLAFDERRFAKADEDVARILALSGVREGAVLDLGCGPGRHSILLAQRGCRVTGVDRSPFLLAKARARAGGVAVEWVQADMREFIRPAAFDLALSIYTSFGYFRTREEDLGTLRNVRASLKQEGVFLIDILSKEFLAARPGDTLWEEYPNGEVLIQHFEVLPGWSRLRVRWILVREDRATHFEFEHTAYSGQELAGLLREAGFSDVRLFGSLEGTPYDASATRLVAWARP